MLICPLCREALAEEPSAFRCSSNHSFDRAKSGYVNLLGARHSGTPGDNKLMVNARREFLAKGYYAPLAKTLCETAEAWISAQKNPRPAILDAGCGEGYYTEKLFSFLKQQGLSPSLVGVDISKFALEKAAKLLKSGRFAVASVFHLPIESGSCDLLCSLFSPYCGEEYLRVLKPQGALLMVIPGRDHLWELKAAVYETPYKNEVKDFSLLGFTLLEKKRLHGSIRLESPSDIANLFMMTPYYYKTGMQDQERLSALKTLCTQTEFHVLLYRKDL